MKTILGPIFGQEKFKNLTERRYRERYCVSLQKRMQNRYRDETSYSTFAC